MPSANGAAADMKALFSGRRELFEGLCIDKTGCGFAIIRDMG